jgi:hypothetical protein
MATPHTSMPGALPLRRRAAAVVAACAAWLLLLPSGAFAARDAEFSVTDDQFLLGNPNIYGAMYSLRSFGFDRVNVSAYWRDHAPDSRALTKPQGFNSENPDDPRYYWERLDRVVQSAAANGLSVTLLITPPAPLWGTVQPARRNPVYRPGPVEFGRFAGAVARRYAGMVDRYAIANEPNQAGWLQPQSDRRGLLAPHLYRELVHAAYPRIKAADPSSLVVIGELAPRGQTKRGGMRPIRPLAFLRAMGCRDRRYRTRTARGHPPRALRTRTTPRWATPGGSCARSIDSPQAVGSPLPGAAAWTST